MHSYLFHKNVTLNITLEICPSIVQHETPSEIFRKQMANLAHAIMSRSNFDQILDKFFSEHIITDTFVDDVMSVQSDKAYQRASKVVHELHRQMKCRQDGKQYLIEICDVLYGKDDVILRCIYSCRNE